MKRVNKGRQQGRRPLSPHKRVTLCCIRLFQPTPHPDVLMVTGIPALFGVRTEGFVLTRRKGMPECCQRKGRRGNGILYSWGNVVKPLVWYGRRSKESIGYSVGSIRRNQTPCFDESDTELLAEHCMECAGQVVRAQNDYNVKRSVE